MISLQKIDFPSDCIITRHNFHNYDPQNDFSEESNFDYLSEDLLQCSFPEERIIVDLGWYGDIYSKIVDGDKLPFELLFLHC